jgi:hypothetical protein
VVLSSQDSGALVALHTYPRFLISGRPSKYFIIEELRGMRENDSGYHNLKFLEFERSVVNPHE